MSKPRLVITREKEKATPSTRLVEIDSDLHWKVKEIKNETGWTIPRILNHFIRYGIENVEIVDPSEKEEEE